jgi:hypothetical protein
LRGLVQLQALLRENDFKQHMDDLNVEITGLDSDLDKKQQLIDELKRTKDEAETNHRRYQEKIDEMEREIVRIQQQRDEVSAVRCSLSFSLPGLLTVADMLPNCRSLARRMPMRSRPSCSTSTRTSLSTCRAKSSSTSMRRLACCPQF